ncbi:MAG: PDZ domain-containing protein [Gemmatimonadaceae bacterium]
MIPVRIRLIAMLAAPLSITTSTKSRPEIRYFVSLDSTNPSSIRVTMQIGGAPRSVRLAMAVHPEYNDRFWRYIRDLRVDAGSLAKLAVDRENVWRLLTHSGSASISYRIELPGEDPSVRGAWYTGIRSDGGSINPVDTFLYLPDFPSAEVEVWLHVPGRVAWGIAAAHAFIQSGQLVKPGEQAQPASQSPSWMAHTDETTLLGSPILYGNTLRFWHFDVERIPHTIAYWPLPNATPFDTAQFVAGIKKVVTEAVAIFGKPPYQSYTFLLEDGAYGALEHMNSVTIGMPSRHLAKDPRAYLAQLAHEFFHTWNLVRLYPEGRGTLSDRDADHSTGLWWSEGVTMYYADALLDRAGFPERGMSRADLIAEELESYYGNPGNRLISPEVASERAVDTTGISGDYQPNYYVQGQLIGTALDLIIRDSTNGRRGLDDLMRALYSRYAMKRGFRTDDVERAASEVCTCNLGPFFDDYVRKPRTPEFDRYFRSIGLQVTTDTIPASDSIGMRLPDTRVWAYSPRAGGRMRVMIGDPSSVWAKAGLHTGDEMVSFNGAAIDSLADLRRAIRAVRLGDVVPVSIVQSGKPALVNVRVTGYDRVRVRIVEVSGATPRQRQRRRLWLSASPVG